MARPQPLPPQSPTPPPAAQASPVPISRQLASFAVIAFLTVLCYLPAMRGEFQFDDAMGIERGGWLLRKGHESEMLWKTLCNWGDRGLVTATYQINYWMSGCDETRMRTINQGIDASRVTPPFHVFNLFVHLLTVAALYALLAWMTWRLGRPSWIVPALGTALFALHPLCTESVAYISARTGPMSAAFALMGITAFLMLGTPGADAAAPEPRGRLVGAVLLVLGILLSVGCKETGWMAPPMAVLALVWAYQGDWKAFRRDWGWASLAGVGLFTAAMGFWIHERGHFSSGWLTSYCMTYNFHPADAFAAFLCHLGTQLNTWWTTQLPRMLLPLGLFHPSIELDPVMFTSSMPPTSTQQAMLALEIALTLGITGWALWRFRSPAALGLSWIAFALVPVTYSAMQDVTAERHAYLPLLGAILVILPLLEAVAKKPWALAGAALAVLCLGGMTAQRAAEWRTEESLWQCAMRDSPRKPRPYYNMAKAMIRRASELTKDEPALGQILSETAVNALHRCLKITPTFHLAHGTLGREFQRKGRFEEAVPEYRMAAGLHASACAGGEAQELHASQVTAVTCSLGECLKSLGRIQEASEDFRRAVNFHMRQAGAAPQGSRMRQMHAVHAAGLYAVLGRLLRDSGHLPEARQVATEGLGIFPGFGDLLDLRKTLDAAP